MVSFQNLMYYSRMHFVNTIYTFNFIIQKSNHLFIFQLLLSVQPFGSHRANTRRNVPWTSV